jgi:hypothetical protein
VGVNVSVGAGAVEVGGTKTVGVDAGGANEEHEETIKPKRRAKRPCNFIKIIIAVRGL